MCFIFKSKIKDQRDPLTQEDELQNTIQTTPAFIMLLFGKYALGTSGLAS